MNSLSKITVLILVLCSNFAIGQEIKTTRDIGLWTSLGIDYKFNKKWQASAEQQIRTFNNALKIKKSITDFGLDYKINKQFKLGSGLRYAYNREKDNLFSHNIRYNLDFKYKRKLSKKADLQYRFRFQSNFEGPFTGFSDFRQTGKLRDRLKLAYEVGNHSLYFGTELFREDIYYRKSRFIGLRLFIGDEIETSSGGLNYGFGYERELNQEYPLNYFFARVNYTFKMKHE